MTSHKLSLPCYYLKPGEMFILEKPSMISTVLGSCIAVTLFNKERGVAGICHALLPQCKKRNHKHKLEDLLDGECHKCLEAFKYADCSVFMMVEAFSRLGITPPETEVRLFGGAKMMSGNSSRDAKYSVGRQNIDSARMVLDHYHLILVSSDVGGSAGRKIIFNTKTGEVVQQFIKKTILRKAKKEDNLRRLNRSVSMERLFVAIK
jgi:chemotaxis protein CheD